MDILQVWRAMEAVFGDDCRRKRHAHQVTSYAKEILKSEPGDEKVVVISAILHDIGIPESIRKYGNANGPNQEKEGPPIARRILQDLGASPALIEEVCEIIASHHSPGEVDSDNFRIVYDADWLVNLPEEVEVTDRRKLERGIGRIFLTETGRRIARETFLS